MVKTIIWNISLALLSGLLLSLSFPEFNIAFLAWIALTPLLLAIKGQSLRYAFCLSFLTAFSFFASIFYWINMINGVKWVDFVLMGIYLSSYIGLFGLVFNLISRRTNIPSIIIAPTLWVSLEYLRSHAGFLGLPWGLLGHSQYLNISIIQISAYTGAYGVSFLIVMVNAALYEFINKRFRAVKSIIITLIVLMISVGYSLNVLSKTSEDGIYITVIQGNIPQHIKWNLEYLRKNLEKHLLLSREAANSGNTSLILWPEASVHDITQHPYMLKKILDLAVEIKSYLLIGSSQRPKFVYGGHMKKEGTSNNAFLITPEGDIDGLYNKIYLLPFAEYLPYKDMIPWPSRFVSKTGSFSPGNRYTVFNINGAKFGVTICWENIFPDLFRQFVKRGANFMVNITNEAWFGETAAPYQFVSMSVFRAVENRVAIARSANTGISCFIDPYGRLAGKVTDANKDIFVEGYLTKKIPLSHDTTFYTMYGDIFAYLNLLMTVLMLSLSSLKFRLG